MGWLRILAEFEMPPGAGVRVRALWWHYPAKADKRTRSKWSRALRYVAWYKTDSEPLEQFVSRKGGINACAARFSRCLGQDAAKRLERRLARR
jgi:hypothetical protein